MAEDARGLPPLPGAEASTGTGLAHGEVPGGRRRQNFWQVVGLMGLPDHDEVHGRAHLPCWSPGLTLLCTSSEPCTVHQLQRGRAGRTDRKEEHTYNVDK